MARERDQKPETGTREASGAGPNQNLKPETGIENPGWSRAIAREPVAQEPGWEPEAGN